MKDPNLGLQRQIILNMPSVGDTAVGDSEQIGRNKINRLPPSFDLSESAGDMPFEIHMDRDVVIGHDHLAKFDTEIRHRRPNLLGREGQALWPPCGRPGGEVWSVKGEGEKSLFVQSLVARIPELVEGRGRPYFASALASGTVLVTTRSSIFTSAADADWEISAAASAAPVIHFCMIGHP
jgi:hypothetical protein